MKKKLKSKFLARSDHLELLRKEVYSWSNYTDVLFVADYPGMILENYINSRHMSNVSLRVLKGKVTYSEEKSLANESGKLLKLNKGDIVRIATGRFHKVKTTGPHPAGYMYAFINRTKLHLGNAGSVNIHKIAFFSFIFFFFFAKKYVWVIVAKLLLLKLHSYYFQLKFDVAIVDFAEFLSCQRQEKVFHCLKNSRRGLEVLKRRWST